MSHINLAKQKKIITNFFIKKAESLAEYGYSNYRKKDKEMQLKEGSKLYYIEYMDHGAVPEPIENIRKNPLTLWSCGYIVNENQEGDPYYALISVGSRFRPSRPRMYEYILKTAIIKKIVIHTIKD